MASPIGSHGSFAIKTDDKGSSINIQISEEAVVKADNLSLSTWGASYVLADLLHTIKIPQRAITSGAHLETLSVLELGAGTGLAGLSAAALWRANAVLTDLPSILPGLASNVRLNQQVLAKCDASPSCSSLDWSDPSVVVPYTIEASCVPEHYHSRFNVILAADTIYSEEHPELLSKTMLTWLAPGPHSRVVLCYPLRMAYIDHIREFWDLLQAGGLECVEEGREEARDEWNEVPGTHFEWCVWAWKSDPSSIGRAT